MFNQAIEAMNEESPRLAMFKASILLQMQNYSSACEIVRRFENNIATRIREQLLLECSNNKLHQDSNYCGLISITGLDNKFVYYNTIENLLLIPRSLEILSPYIAPLVTVNKGML